MICWLGDVEAWVNTASLNGLLVVVVVLVAHQHHRALAQADIDLCIELVW